MSNDQNWIVVAVNDTFHLKPLIVSPVFSLLSLLYIRLHFRFNSDCFRPGGNERQHRALTVASSSYAWYIGPFFLLDLSSLNKHRLETQRFEIKCVIDSM